jgi:glycerol uptake operon antiterminator
MATVIIHKREQSLDFSAMLARTPVLPAVESDEKLEQCLALKAEIILVLYGDILSIPAVIERIHRAGKRALVHIDLIDGLASRDPAADYLAKAGADGILSTKPNIIKRAKSLGLIAIQRFFLLDSRSLANVEKQFPLEYADALEILPGIIPKVTRRIAFLAGKPLIASGLIQDSSDVETARAAGAVSVSTSRLELCML